MFCTYATIHPETGKYYLGKGKLDGVLCGRYKGSGKLLKDAFKKYPRAQWVTLVIDVFSSEDDAYFAEKQLVTEDVLVDTNCLNIKLGGLGQTRNYKVTEDTKKRIGCGLRKWALENPAEAEEAKKRRASGVRRNEARQKLSIKLTVHGAKEEVRTARSKAAKNNIARPEHRAAFLASRNTPEYRAAVSAGQKTANDEVRRKRFPADIVRAIYEDGRTFQVIAKHFGCSRTIVGKIKHRDTLFEYAWH